MDRDLLARYHRPREYSESKPDLAMPNFDFDDFTETFVEGICLYNNKWIGLPFDIPIFTLMYRKDILEKHGIPVPRTYEDFTKAVETITAAEKKMAFMELVCKPNLDTIRLNVTGLKPFGVMVVQSSGLTKSFQAMMPKGLKGLNGI